MESRVASTKSQGFDIRSQDDDRAVVYIYEEIGFFGVSAGEFVRDIAAIGSPLIELHINSPGGSFFDSMAIYHALVRHSAEVEVHVDGIAASGASLIAMAGDEINIADGAFLMIHESWSFAIGNASEMREVADLLEKIDDSQASILARRSGQTKTQIRHWLEDETWFNAEEAVNVGFADSVENSDKTEAETRIEDFDIAALYENLPPELAVRLSTNNEGNEETPYGDRRIESALRDAGYSRSEQKRFVSAGKAALARRDAGSAEVKESLKGLLDTFTKA